MNRSISERDIKLLYARSAGLCNMCGISVFLPKINEDGYIHIGQMAHNIAYANNEKSPRFIDKRSGDNSYNNLILLCANDHLIVDQNTHFYTVQKLNQIKKEFEQNITQKTNIELKPDQHLVNLINQKCNFQFLFHNLEETLYSIPFRIICIGDIYESVLEPNYPTFYPFKDHTLNEYLNNITKAYFELRPLLIKYYTVHNAEIFIQIREKSISPIDQNLILTTINTLRKFIYNWLVHCRQYYCN